MMTAEALTINPRYQGQGPKSKPTAGGDNEDDLEPIEYMAIAEDRHSSLSCLDLPHVSRHVCSCFILYTRTRISLRSRRVRVRDVAATDEVCHEREMPDNDREVAKEEKHRADDSS